MKRYDRFADFYPVYLAMHSHPTNRRLHLLGNALALGALAYAIATHNFWALLAMPALASGLAFIGHRFFQKNKPGVRHYPVWGTIGNWVMTKDVLLGKLRW
jgi:hypothetical protein